jgi:hypothetical protein
MHSWFYFDALTNGMEFLLAARSSVTTTKNELNRMSHDCGRHRTAFSHCGTENKLAGCLQRNRVPARLFHDVVGHETA